MAPEYGRTLIIPMTMVNPDYRDEIFGLISKAGEHALHVFLDVPLGELHRRIDNQVLYEDNPEADASAREFRHRNAARCAAARDSLRGDEHTPAQLADQVLEALS
jgi:hypothetical protein